MSKQTKEKPLIPATTSNVDKNKKDGMLYRFQGEKYEIFPNSHTKKEFRRIFGANRIFRNHLIEYNKWEQKIGTFDGFVGYEKNKFSSELTALRNFNIPYLGKMPRTPQRKVADNLVISYTELFNGNKNEPKFKSRKKQKNSFTLINGDWNTKDGPYKPNGRTKLKGEGAIRFDHLDTKNRHIRLPSFGWVPIRMERDIPDNTRIISATISLKNNRWYASVTYRTADLPVFGNARIVGVDLGARSARAGGNSIVLSDGTCFVLPAIIEELEDEIDRMQRRLDKKKATNDDIWQNKKGASVRPEHIKRPETEAEKQLQLEINLLYERITNIRNNFLHHVSSYIAENYDWVVIENLNIKALSKSNKGTKRKPGKNRAANKAKNRAILRQGWGIFRVMLEYKMRVIPVHPANTSIQCCLCPRKDTAARKDEVYNCTNPDCDNLSHADWNAAINVLEKGLQLMEDEGVAIPSKTDKDVKAWKAELGLELNRFEF